MKSKGYVGVARQAIARYVIEIQIFYRRIAMLSQA